MENIVHFIAFLGRKDRVREQGLLNNFEELNYA